LTLIICLRRLENMASLRTSFAALRLTQPTNPSPPTFCMLRTTSRAFSTTPRSYGRLNSKKQLALEHRDIPPYPHGPARLYKKSNFGLYGGARVRFGNIVSKGKWVKKTRRKWSPNVQRTQLFSEALGKQVKLKATTSVMRTVDKVGGLDNYLLGSSSARIKELGMKGWKLRWDIMQTDAIQKRFKQEREKMGMNSEAFEEQVKQMEQLKTKFETEWIAKPSKEEKAQIFRNKRKRKDVLPDDFMRQYAIAVQEAVAAEAADPSSRPGLELEPDLLEDQEEGQSLLASSDEHGDGEEAAAEPSVPLSKSEQLAQDLWENPELWDNLKERFKSTSAKIR
jgi:ribosomal protein L28